MSVTEALKDHIRERTEHFRRYFDQIIDVHVTLSEEKYRHSAEISVFGKHLKITEKREASDMVAAIDDVCSRLGIALGRHKDKLKVHRKSYPAAKARAQREEV